MFCPKCATQNVDGAHYCRACGANISLVPQALTGQLQSPITSRYQEKLQRRKRRGEPSIETAIRSLTMGVAFAVIMAMISKFTPGGSTWAFWLLIPAASFFAKGFAELARLHGRRNEPPAPGQPQLNTVRLQEMPTAKTGELAASVPSVTEGTTRLLDHDPARPYEPLESQKPS